MPYFVYIAKPPAGGGYPPDTFKIGMTTEGHVGDRITALNNSGSNYTTADGAEWELHQQFEFNNAEQMEAFEAAMMERLDAGTDRLGTGATELFHSSDPLEDITEAARGSFKALVEEGHLDPAEIASIAEANGIAPPGSAADFAELADLSPEAAEFVIEKSADWLFEVLMAGTTIGGVGIVVWRGQRILRWGKRLWKQSQASAQKEQAPRAAEPDQVTLALEAFRALKRRES